MAIAIEVALHVHGTHSAESAAHWHIATAVVHLRVLLLLRLEVLILVGSDAMRAHATVCDFSLHARTALAALLRRLERLDRFRLDGEVGQLDVVFPCCCTLCIWFLARTFSQDAFMQLHHLELVEGELHLTYVFP